MVAGAGTARSRLSPGPCQSDRSLRAAVVTLVEAFFSTLIALVDRPGGEGPAGSRSCLEPALSGAACLTGLVWSMHALLLAAILCCLPAARAPSPRWRAPKSAISPDPHRPGRGRSKQLRASRIARFSHVSAIWRPTLPKALSGTATLSSKLPGGLRAHLDSKGLDIAAVTTSGAGRCPGARNGG